MTEYTSLAQINAAKVANAQAIIDAMSEVQTMIEELDPELFLGGMPMSLGSAKNMIEVQKREIAKGFGISLPTSGPALP